MAPPDHPLSPNTHPSFPSLSRTVSTLKTPIDGYFDRPKSVGARTGLGIKEINVDNGPSPTSTSMAGPSRYLDDGFEPNIDPLQSSTILASLNPSEMAVANMRFDLMSDEELGIYMNAFDFTLGKENTEKRRDQHIATSSTSASASSSSSYGRDPPPTRSISIRSPKKIPISHTPGDKSPLFPPSPPTSASQGHPTEHPLRILSKAIYELREATTKLEQENARLRAQLDKRKKRQADVASIHNNLTEALSTSLNDGNTTIRLPDPPSIPRSGSPNPSISKSVHSLSQTTTQGGNQRAESPFQNDIPGPKLSKVRSRPETPQTPPTNSISNLKQHRPSWTSGLWVWGSNGKKTPSGSGNNRPRKGSTSSLASGSILPVSESALVDDEEDEHVWRKGDGGSSPAFRAIFLATRIVTPDPSSILISSTIPSSSLIAYLAHSLITNAQEAGIIAKDPPGRRRSSKETRSRATSIASQNTTTSRDFQPNSSTSKDRGYGYGDQALAATASIGRSIFSSVSNATLRGGPKFTGETIRPSLLSRASSARPNPTTALMTGNIDQPPTYSSSAITPTEETPPPSVELASIVHVEATPPTVLLSRQNLGSFFQSSKNVPTLRTASRFSTSEPPLTDRYGFIYDIQHAALLKDASAAGTAAPASLNGTLPNSHLNPHTPVDIAGEGWIDRQRRKQDLNNNSTNTTNRPSVSRSSTSSVSLHSSQQIDSPRPSIDSAVSTTFTVPETTSSPTPDRTPPSSRSASRTPNLNHHHHHHHHRHRASTIHGLNHPPPPKAIVAKETLTVSARGASSLQTGIIESSPISISAELAIPSSSPASGGDESAKISRNTVSSLLDQLTVLHDQQQKELINEWDVFLKKRKNKMKASGGMSNGLANGGGNGNSESMGVSGIIGINQMGGSKSGIEEWKSFARLVRRGIPLAYRADVWAECSGARDAMVPGEYSEILAVHANDTSPFLAEIEKDVSRTFPGNVFFGGDGPGVAKLRRVLVAYSWHNPGVGYCQGMNMLAATLLLTHPEEEQAYWVLLSLIDRLLPQDFFSPSLLASRADQLVLEDLVRQYIPKIHNHLIKIGLDLASVTFGWFLSLFTDCLPVETLFRVWDVFFVEGHDSLFRIAIAILKMAEPDLCACETVSDVFTFVGGMTSRLWAADRLIALAHNYKPIIRHTDIAARCEKHVATLQAEIAGIVEE